MDISDLIKSIEKVIPILIFLVWMLIALFANSRKRGPTGKPLPPSERPTYRESQNLPQKTEEENTQIGDELRRTLETIFGESTTREKKVPEPQPEAESIESESVEESESQEASILEEQAAIRREFEAVQKKASNIAAMTAPLQPAMEETDESTFSVTHDELRKGIILAEIIAPPVSLRN